MQQPVLISQGAEARVFLTTHLGTPAIIKQRFPKSYRLPQLDQKLTKQRILQEVRSLHKSRNLGVDTPFVYFVDLENNCIVMEVAYGHTVRDWLGWRVQYKENDHRIQNSKEGELACLFSTIGKNIASLHNADIIHGDLTTSNMILRTPSSSANTQGILSSASVEIPSPPCETLSPMTSTLTIIDFGLSYTSIDPEDKAVDLYVLERAVKSTHPQVQEAYFDKLLESYGKSCKQGKIVIKRLEAVRLRGRKRSMLG